MNGESQQQPARGKRNRRRDDKESEVLIALRSELKRQGIPDIPAAPSDLVPFAILVHMVRCEGRAISNSDELRHNTGMTETVNAAVAKVQADVTRVLTFLQPDMTAEDRRAKAWKALGEFFETGKAFLQSRRASPALIGASASLGIYVLWKVGGFEALAALIHFLKAI